MINEKGPRRASLRMLRDVDADSFVSAFTDGLRTNLTEAQMTSLKPQIDAFSSTLKSIGEAKKGDVINFDYTPDGGTRITVNGQPKGAAIAGHDFYCGRDAHLARRQAGRRRPEKGPARRLTMHAATASRVRAAAVVAAPFGGVAIDTDGAFVTGLQVRRGRRAIGRRLPATWLPRPLIS